jgi:hypothetical protein
MGFIWNSKLTKNHQRCTILVHERGEHRHLHPKHQQWPRGGVGVVGTPLVIVINNCWLELSYTVGIDHPQPNENCVVNILRVHDPSVRYNER